MRVMLKRKTTWPTSLNPTWNRSSISEANDIRRPTLSTEYRATYPGFEMVRNVADPSGLKRFLISQTPLPENHFTGNNRTRYMNPDFDALLQKFFVTIPLQKRAQLLSDIIDDMTGRVLVIGLYWDADATAIGSRLANAAPRQLNSTQVWNVEEWDLAA